MSVPRVGDTVPVHMALGKKVSTQSTHYNHCYGNEISEVMRINIEHSLVSKAKLDENGSFYLLSTVLCPEIHPYDIR